METSEAIHAISEPARFKILQLLLEHPYCVKALSKKLGISESAVSQHMKLLKSYKIVYSEKRGYQTHYIVDTAFVRELADAFSVLFSAADSGLPDECSCEFVTECTKREPKRSEAV